MHTKKTRWCWRCRKVTYWNFHLCKNKDCQWWYGRADAAEHAKERFLRKIWRRAVEGKGRLHPAIEKNLKTLGWNHTQAM